MSELVAESSKTNAVSRLRESRRLKAESDKIAGAECCRTWMEGSDDSEELAEQVERLLKAKEHLDEYGSECIADLVASHALDTTCFNDKDGFWQEVSGKSFPDVSDAFAEGFLNEVAEIAAQANAAAD